MAKQKILIVRVGRGGDLVMITPALDALLAAFPSAEFHLLTSLDGPRILGGLHPSLTRMWLYHRRLPGRLILERKLGALLRDQGYARIFAFESKPFYRRWLSAFAPEFHGLATGGAGHFCDRCLDLVQRSLTRPIDRRWVQLPVSPDAQARARELLAAHGLPRCAGRADKTDRTLLVGFHATFSGTPLPFFRDRRGARHRTWPRAHFARLAMLLHERALSCGQDLAVVIDALPRERTFVETIARLSGGAITLLTAPPDFQRYKALLQCLDVLVTPNTGPMHIAAAVGTPLVALFSRWRADECGPYTDPRQYHVLAAEDTPHARRGLAAIEPEAVAEAVWSLLADQ